MKETEAKKQIRILKAFHGHLLLYAVFMGALSVVNFMTVLNGDPQIWVIYPLVCWGAIVLLQGIGAYQTMGGGKQWEEQKLRELTGWKSTDEQLARLEHRIDTLLSILSTDDHNYLGPALLAARTQLLEARRAVEHYQAPLDSPEETDLTKQDVVDLVERLEAIVTRREFREFEDAKVAVRQRRRSAAES